MIKAFDTFFLQIFVLKDFSWNCERRQLSAIQIMDYEGTGLAMAVEPLSSATRRPTTMQFTASDKPVQCYYWNWLADIMVMSWVMQYSWTHKLRLSCPTVHSLYCDEGCQKLRRKDTTATTQILCKCQERRQYKSIKLRAMHFHNSMHRGT